MSKLVLAITLAGAATSAAALKPVDRMDAASVTLERNVAPLPTFAPLPVVADAPDKALDDNPDLPLRRAALREWAAENNRVEGLGEKVDIDVDGIIAAAARSALPVRVAAAAAARRLRSCVRHEASASSLELYRTCRRRAC